MLYSQQYNDTFYYHDTESQEFTFHNFILPSTQEQQKPQRRLSFSTLLQKRPSIMGRKLSIFSRQKKPQLKVMIPLVAEENDKLERTDTSASNSTDGDGPVTPTSSTSPPSSLYYNNKRSSTISSDDLETAITMPSTRTHLMDYSGKGYSNFYIKLPNGNWMVRVRDGNRKIVGTYEIDGSMI